MMPASTDGVRILDDLAVVRAWAAETLSRISVAVVYGSISAEDLLYIAKSPVEQMSITALSQTLGEIGVRFEVLDPCQPSFLQKLTRFDVVLPNLHGPFGEDGRLQGLLDYLSLPYCGSGVAASATAADKVRCKRLMEALAIPTPTWRVWPGTGAAWPDRPVMVKPRMGGSSIGMSLVLREADLIKAIRDAESSDPPGVLIEDHIPGVPVTVGVLELPGGIAIFPPLATQVHASDFYDADAKLDEAAIGTITAAQAALSAPTATTLHSFVRQLWEELDCHGMARVDFIVADDGTAFALEVNTTPGMSHASNFVTGARLLGLSEADLVTAILREALTRPRYDAPLSAPDFGGRRMET